MDQQYREARRLIVECRNMLETLESACANTALDPIASISVSESMKSCIEKLIIVCESLRHGIVNEPPSRRQVYRARLRDIEDQILELRNGEERCSLKLKRNARERDLLLNSSNQNSHSLTIGLMDVGEETRKLDDSTKITGNILNTGREAISQLVHQRDRLRGARKKVLDILHQIGVDRNLIARIERREQSDMLLMYGLMIGILILLGLAVLWKYHRRRIAA